MIFWFGFVFRVASGFLKNVLGTMVFTVFSAHSHFVQTLFFQSLPFKFASKFRLFFAVFFIEKLRKFVQKSVLSLISQLEPLFAVFWFTFSDFWPILADFGRPGAAGGQHFWKVLGLQKREQNLIGFWGAFLKTQGEFGGLA